MDAALFVLAGALIAGLIRSGQCKGNEIAASDPRPERLAELRDWLSSSVQLPLASATARRILPHGPVDAAVLLRSDAPALGRRRAP